jgi:hypothetical protein
VKALRLALCCLGVSSLFALPCAALAFFFGWFAHALTTLRPLAVLLALGALTGCTYRSDAEERRLADSQATMWEAAQAIRIGRDPSGPVQVIQANASACAGALGHPYPPKETP